MTEPGTIIRALRLYAEKEDYLDRYTPEELKLLEEAGVFYGTTMAAPRIKRLTRYARPDLHIELDKSLARHVSIIEKTPHIAIVKVKNDSAVLELRDLFWLAKLELYPSEELKLLKWISNNLKLDLPEKSRLYRTFGGVAIETGDGRTYYIFKSGTIKIEETVDIDGVKYRASVPIDKKQVAINITKELLSKILNNTKIINSNRNSIFWYTNKTSESKYDVLTVETRLELGGRRFSSLIRYIVPTGTVSVSISPVSYKYRYSMIHHILASRYGLDRDVPTSTLIYTGETDIETATNLVRQALYLLSRAKLISEREPEKLVHEIEKALEEKKMPIIPAEISGLDIAKLYFYGISRNNEKLEVFLRKTLRYEVEQRVKSFISKELLKNYVEKLGSPKAKEELESMLSEKKETELVEA